MNIFKAKMNESFRVLQAKHPHFKSTLKAFGPSNEPIGMNKDYIRYARNTLQKWHVLDALPLILEVYSVFEASYKIKNNRYQFERVLPKFSTFGKDPTLWKAQI